MSGTSYKRDVLRELVLYVAERQSNDATFGRVKLTKLLFYADCEAFARLGEPISGATYQKLPEGPAAVQFVPLREQLLMDGDASETAFDWPNGKRSWRLVANRPADVSVFSTEQLEVIDAVLARFDGVSGTEISRISHEEVGWRVGTMNEPIPYEAYLIAPKATPAQRKAAVEKAATLDLVG